jgi:Raf kinase inhibitor-like YbhB/YbcL family protein
MITSRHSRRSALALLRVALLLTLGCGGGKTPTPPSASPNDPEGTMSINLTSSAFADSQAIPVKYTCDGQDVSPPLTWSGVPEGAKSLALICDDPDAPGGTWVHWVLYNMGPTTTKLAEGISPSESLPDGAKQGVNDFNRTGYGGPCPPRGAPHRYFFKLYALDKEIDPRPRLKKDDVVRAMTGHILAEGRLIGTYNRR